MAGNYHHVYRSEYKAFLIIDLIICEQLKKPIAFHLLSLGQEVWSPSLLPW